MAERYIDIKINTLEKICENISHSDNPPYALIVSSTDTKIVSIVEELHKDGLLEILQMMLVNNDSEFQEDSDEKVEIIYQPKNRTGLDKLLKKLKQDFPKREVPLIKEQALEKISRHLGEMMVATKIISLLKSWGVPDALIEYPNTKWIMIFNILNYCSISAKKEDYNILKAILEGIVHPLMYDGNFGESQKTADSFNNLLFFDNFTLRYSADNKKYNLEYEPTDSEMEEAYEQTSVEELKEEYLRQEKQAKEDRVFYSKPENIDRIAMLRKTYQLLINITETFCLNPSNPDQELNDAYLKTCKIIRDIVSDLRAIKNIPIEIRSLLANLNFPLGGSNLFGAESLFNRRNEELSWKNLRPKMNYSYGEIDDIFRQMNGSDIISEPDIQKSLNDISLLLSKTKEKNDSLALKKKEEVNSQKNSPLKIEISSMPALEIKDIEKIGKNSSKTVGFKFPYNLPAGTEWKNIVFQFENNEDVYMQVKQYKHHTNYKEMGLLGKGKNPKPSEIWNLLKVLSKLNGELTITDGEQKQKYKKQKQLLSDTLKSYFSIDSDPFYPYEENQSYRIKMTLLPPPTDSALLSEPLPDEEIDNDIEIDNFYKEQTQ